MKEHFKEFLITFYQRWKADEESDEYIEAFSNKRQQDADSIETRDRIMRQLFFEFYPEAKIKAAQRGFNEAQRIKIYRDQKGICQDCLKEVKEEDAKVPWKEYEADHILAYSLGGNTENWNAQVLCRKHNKIKSNR